MDKKQKEKICEWCKRGKRGLNGHDHAYTTSTAIKAVWQACLDANGIEAVENTVQSSTPAWVIEMIRTGEPVECQVSNAIRISFGVYISGYDTRTKEYIDIFGDRWTNATPNAKQDPGCNSSCPQWHNLVEHGGRRQLGIVCSVCTAVPDWHEAEKSADKEYSELCSSVFEKLGIKPDKAAMPDLSIIDVLQSIASSVKDIAKNLEPEEIIVGGRKMDRMGTPPGRRDVETKEKAPEEMSLLELLSMVKVLADKEKGTATFGIPKEAKEWRPKEGDAVFINCTCGTMIAKILSFDSSEKKAFVIDHRGCETGIWASNIKPFNPSAIGKKWSEI